MTVVRLERRDVYQGVTKLLNVTPELALLIRDHLLRHNVRRFNMHSDAENDTDHKMSHSEDCSPRSVTTSSNMSNSRVTDICLCELVLD